MLQRIHNLLSNRENSKTEFKLSFSKAVIETITAFTNTQGGTILIGVNDNGEIKGVGVNMELIKDWTNKIKIATQPQIFPVINPIDVDGKTIVEIVINEFPLKPVSYKGRYYKRIGASNHLINTDEIAEMQLFSINSSFDAFVVDSNLSELDKSLIDNFFDRIKRIGRLKLSDDNVSNLNKLGLFKNGKPTYASFLLFGNHNTGIHIGRFKTPEVIIDDLFIRSPLITAVDEAMAAIKKNINVRFKFTGELQRKEIWQYPLEVIREILLNAIIHRNYQTPNDIIIKIFDAHILFTNPGKLLCGLRVEDLMTDEYIAVHRNKLLAEAFYLLGEVEKYGTGISRVRNILKRNPGISFFIEDTGNFIKIALKTDLKTENDTINDIKNDTINDIKSNNETNNLKKKIIILLAQERVVTIPEIANRCNKSVSTINRNIKELKNIGKIERVGGKKGGYWKVNLQNNLK